MRATLPIVLVFISAIVLSGCGDYANKSTSMPINGQEANARIDAAIQILSPNDKDTALAAACRYAAKIGESDAVMRGIPMIVGPNLVDEVAQDCSMSLRDSGKLEAATAVAGMIKSPNLRDEVLKKLASGK